MPATQKALLLTSNLESLLVVDRPIPQPGPGQLLVRIEASSLNPIDWKVQRFGLYLSESQYPAVLGSDVSGVVEDCGDNVSGFTVGDRVVFPASWLDGHGAFQQYTLGDAAITAKLPLQVSFEEASTLPVALAAAVVGLYLPEPYGAALTPPFGDLARGKYPGKPIVILGGATSVGQFVIQLAKLSGFSPIIVTASAKHSEFLKSLGATHFLDRHIPTDKLSANIKEISSGTPIEIVYDAVSSSDTQNMGYDLVANNGKLIVTLEPAIAKEIPGKGVIRVIGVWTLPHSRGLGIELYAALTGLLEKGLIKPNRLEVVPGGLGGIVSGLERLEADLVSGVKLVVRPQTTI